MRCRFLLDYKTISVNQLTKVSLADNSFYISNDTLGRLKSAIELMRKTESFPVTTGKYEMIITTIHTGCTPEFITQLCLLNVKTDSQQNIHNLLKKLNKKVN